MKKLYMAGKIRHAPAFRKFARLLPNSWVVNSTWINRVGTRGESSENLSEVAIECITEASEANVLLIYLGQGEDHTGVYAELGAALANNATVMVIGVDTQQCILWEHPNIWRFNTLREALAIITTTIRGIK